MILNQKELFSLVNALSLKDLDIIPYRGRNYWIQITENLEPPAWYSTSTLVDGADIYLDKQKIPQKFQKPVILHEIIEADLSIHQNIPLQKAHQLAQEEDRTYASLFLSSTQREEYEKLRERLEASFGPLGI